MYLTGKIRNIFRGLLQSYGPTSVKSYLWNAEFSSDRWDCLDETPGDYLYPYVQTMPGREASLILDAARGIPGANWPRIRTGITPGLTFRAWLLGKLGKEQWKMVA